MIGQRQNQIGERAFPATPSTCPDASWSSLQAVVATGTPTVAVADVRTAARPALGTVEHVPAILQVWYPGTRGAVMGCGGIAVRRHLPRRRQAALQLAAARGTGAGDPLALPHVHAPDEAWQAVLGGGIHAAVSLRFRPVLRGVLEYCEPTAVGADAIAVGETATVSVDVSNTSFDRWGDEVIQLYIHQRYGDVQPADPGEPKAFERVAVAAGATRTVEFELGPDQLRYWSAVTRDWVQDATTYDLGVGTDSTVELGTTFDVTA